MILQFNPFNYLVETLDAVEAADAGLDSAIVAQKTVQLR